MMNNDYTQLAYLVKEATDNAKAWAKYSEAELINAYKYHMIVVNTSNDKNKQYYIYMMLELQSILMHKEAKALASAEALIAEAEAEVAECYEALEAIKNRYINLMNDSK